MRVEANKFPLKPFKEVFQEAKIMSWWDYGYQITAMANRTVIVDNNTWNNTHISRVGQVNSFCKQEVCRIS